MMKWLKRIEILLEVALVALILALADEVFLPKTPAVSQTAPRQTAADGGDDPQDAVLPTRYDARADRGALTVKNQGNLGTCWAIAASSALEASCLPQERVVFSADHISLQNAFSFGQDDGGDYTMVMAYLAGWQGPVAEADDPYGDGVSPEGLSPIKHVQEMQLFAEKDYAAIKRAVMRCGAVQSSLYMDAENAFRTSVYYNQLEHSYAYDGVEDANHDILIIGWDDAYDASRFHRRPRANGAFLCQNSWGEQFGDHGVFWVSYEDVNIGKHTIALTKVADADNYDHIYQTDPCGWVGQLGYGDGHCYFANVFTAEREETLAAVGFYLTGPDTRYTVYFVEAFVDKTFLLPQKAICAGEAAQAEFYTAEFSEGIPLFAGQRYAVIVEVDSQENDYPVATEYAGDEATKSADISDGEGYISHNGLVWTRTETAHGANVCMKAYTKMPDA